MGAPTSLPGVTGRSRRTDRPAWAAALLVILVVASYLPALEAGFVWDDDYHVTANAPLLEPGGLSRIWTDASATPQYYPLTHTTFWIERRVWGLHAAGYHAVNLVLHALTAVLAFAVLRTLAVPGAWLAAAVFALHPVQVESVAWISERKNVLSGALYMGALALWLRASLPPAGAKRARSRIASVALYVAALLSKTVTATFPLVAGLLVFWKRGRLRRAETLLLTAMLLAGAALAVVTVALEHHQIGASGEEWSLSPLERVLLACRVPWFYLGKLALPVRLSFIYPRWTIDASSPAAWLYPLALAGAFGSLWGARRRVGLGPLVALACFLATLSPALGFFNVYPMRYSYVADHFQYLAGLAPIALAAAAAAGATSAFRRTRPTDGLPIEERIAVAALLAALGWATWGRTLAFRDAETLWRDTLAKNPGAWIAHNNLGPIVADRGDLGQARFHFREAIRLKPDHVGARRNLAELDRREGRNEEAVKILREAVLLAPDDSGVTLELAAALDRTGRLDEAVASYRRALSMRPTDPATMLRLANALGRSGRPAEAIPLFEEGLRRTPEDAESHYDLGTILAREGRLAEAIAHLSEAVRLRPGFEPAKRNLDLARRLARNAGAVSPPPASP